MWNGDHAWFTVQQRTHETSVNSPVAIGFGTAKLKLNMYVAGKVSADKLRAKGSIMSHPLFVPVAVHARVRHERKASRSIVTHT